MRTLIRSAALAALIPAALGAQGAANCSATIIDGCRKAEDLYRYMMPQFSLGLSGGNPVLGSNGVIGSLGHFSIGVRLSAVQGSIPEIDQITASATGPVDVKDQWVPAPALDAAIGLFKGFPVGVSRIGSVDGIVSFMYLPDVGDGDDDGTASFKVADGNTRFGFGARVGIIDESIALPSVSFAYLSRGMPKFTASGDTEDDYTIGVEELDITVTTWRVIATKSLVAFALSAGFGGDTYDTDGRIFAVNPGGTIREEVSLAQKISRTNWFVGLTLGMGPLDLAAEYGRASGGTVTTFNSFDPKADAPRSYVSLGLRFGL